MIMKHVFWVIFQLFLVRFGVFHIYYVFMCLWFRYVVNDTAVLHICLTRKKSWVQAPNKPHTRWRLQWQPVWVSKTDIVNVFIVRQIRDSIYIYILFFLPTHLSSSPLTCHFHQCLS